MDIYNMKTIKEICSVFLLCAGGLAGCINAGGLPMVGTEGLDGF